MYGGGEFLDGLANAALQVEPAVPPGGAGRAEVREEEEAATQALPGGGFQGLGGDPKKAEAAAAAALIRPGATKYHA